MIRRARVINVLIPVVSAISISVSLSAQTPVKALAGALPDAVRSTSPARTLSMPKILALPAAAPGTVAAPTIAKRPEFDHPKAVASAAAPRVAVGGANAAASKIVSGDATATGFEGINISRMETAGTGKYAGINGGLEPPDQAVCAGNGYVVEGVNQAWQFFQVGPQKGSQKAVTPVIPIAQLFQTSVPTLSVSGVSVVGGTFLSDPRCYYDAPTKRWFLITLEIDENVGGLPYGRAHNLVAVSKTSSPVGDYWLYSFDITDDGLMGTPQHLTCPCIGDQPLLGADANGFYLSTNEYSDAELLPAAPPPAANPLVNTIFTLPDFRNGHAQVYAMSKQKLENGGSIPVVSYDTATIPLPGSPPNGALWSSLQPSHSPPGDLSSGPANGAEFFLSSIDWVGAGATQIASWALTNTAALNADSPNASQMALQHVLLTPKSGGYQYLPPDGSPFSAVQKDGPHGSIPPTIGVQPGCLAGCPEETINGNDDRMNTTMLTNGVLWSGVNTVLPPGPDGHYRVGIEYFAVAPRIADGTLQATMQKDGYVNVPNENVLFPSIAATPTGAVVMGFSISGPDYFPSTGWTRLDLPVGGAGPDVHISGIGTAPEDGFTGYAVQGLVPNPAGLIANGVARWGDYSATEVDENGCVWSAAEYIPPEGSDGFAGDWGTFITRVSPGGATCALSTPPIVVSNAAGAGTSLPGTSTQRPINFLLVGLLAVLVVLGAASLLKRPARSS